MAAVKREKYDENVPIRTLRKPKTLREVEREAHEAAGHTPYRDWCANCVAGAGRGRPTGWLDGSEPLGPLQNQEWASFGRHFLDRSGRFGNLGGPIWKMGSKKACFLCVPPFWEVEKHECVKLLKTKKQ